MRFAARTVSAVLLVAAARVAPADEADRRPATLTLADGGTVTGELLASEEPEILRWQGTSFTAPFEFVVPAVSSVSFPAVPSTEKPAGDFSFELAGGDVLTGRIRGWSDETVTVESPHFGTLSIRRRALRRMYRIDENPSLVYTGPAGLAGWMTDGPGWREDGPHLEADEDGASLTGEFKIPDRAVVEFEVTWERVPDFVFAIGVDGRSKSDSRLDGWRFETWGDQERTLALVCERSDEADVAEVGILPASTTPPSPSPSPSPPRRLDMRGVDPFRGAAGADGVNRTYFQPKPSSGMAKPAKPPVPEKRAHLIAYLDQSAGSMKVYRPDGAFAAEVVVPPPAGKPMQGVKRTVRLINRAGDLRLERLRIARWNGALPTGGGGPSRLELADGGVLTGEVIALREDTRELAYRSKDGEQTVPLRDVVAAEFASESPSEKQPVTAMLADGTRVTGALGGFPAGQVVVISPDILEPLRIPHASVRSLAFAERSVEGSQGPTPPGRQGILELDGRKLTGSLEIATETPDASCLAWQPVGSRTASPIKPRAAGRVVYCEPPKPRPVARQVATLQGRVVVGAQGQMMNMRVQRPSQTLPPAGSKRRQGPPHDMHLRSGDVIPCEVIAIDERGIHITSPVAEAKLVPHASVKAIELAAGTLPDLRAAKKERLLTLPRAQRDSPPTHLLHSRTGDLLRCRLVALGPETVRVEVQLTEIDIPMDRVSRIVWFHEDEMMTADDGADEKAPSDATKASINRAHFDPAKRTEPQTASTSIARDARVPVEAPLPRENRQLVQILRTDGDRTTFDADAVDAEAISGTSAVLGACRFVIAEVDMIIFGERIEAAAGLPYAAWRLRHAVEPLVAQDFDGSGGDSGTASPLVGQPAPEIALTLLDGGGFRLSECKGQIVVLDFWASWCGPCIQTMPLTEQAMAEFDPAAVRLVTVNLEEPADHVRGVMERHDLRAAVALDVDGVAARRYQADAIPQVVVVDREGNVSRVFVGGGREAVEQLKASLNELLSGE